MFKNFYNTLRCYKASSILNIIGLTVAFTAFTIIMIQVNFDHGFDAFHSKGDRTFRLEYTTDSLEYRNSLSRPVGEKIISLSPNIEYGTTLFHRERRLYAAGDNPEKGMTEWLVKVKPDATSIFEFKFTEGDGTKLATKNSVIISRSFAEKLYPSEKAVGKEVCYMNGDNQQVSLLISGVFEDFPRNSMLYGSNIFIDAANESLNNQSEWSFQYFITLRSADQKQEIESLIAKYAKEEFNNYERFKIRLTPLPEIHFSSDMGYDQVPKADRTTMSVLMSVAIIILVIAIINFLNFALALTPLRLRSINIHKIMGSTVTKLRLYQISEAVLFSAISFGFAVLIVKWISTSGFTSIMTAPIELSLNSDMIILSGIIALLTGVAAGIIPAFYSTSFQPAMAIKGSFGNSKSGRMFRTALIGFQYVSSIVLFCAALFMIVQNQYMKSHPVGFNRDNIVCAFVSGTVAKSPDVVYSKLMDNPLIKDVTFSAAPIISDGKMGWGRMYKQKQVAFDCVPVSSNFIRFMGMQMVQGRDFTKEDELKENGTFIFNEKAIAEFGFQVGEGLNGHADTLANIVGVVRNFNFQPMQYGIKPVALYVFGSKPWWPMSFLNVRISGQNVAQAIDFIGKTIKEIDPQTTDIDIKFLDERVGALYEKEQNQAILIIIFAVVAMIISLVGVFGLVIFETQYRRKEIGLRKINGATTLVILTMFNRKFIAIVGVCFLIALPISIYAINEWLEGFAYRTPMHWWVFALSIAIVIAITVLTVTVQSWRAASENPIKSLRDNN